MPWLAMNLDPCLSLLSSWDYRLAQSSLAIFSFVEIRLGQSVVVFSYLQAWESVEPRVCGRPGRHSEALPFCAALQAGFSVTSVHPVNLSGPSVLSELRRPCFLSQGSVAAQGFTCCHVAQRLQAGSQLLQRLPLSCPSVSDRVRPQAAVSSRLIS